jgi:hypothetical protein
MSKISLVVRKVTMIATVSALALAAFSATNVFAASPTTTAISTQDAWKAEASAVQVQSEILSRFDRNSDGVVFRNGMPVRRDEQGKDDAQLGVKIFNLWLTKANEILSTHAGFDASGMVTDQAQATKSVQDLAIDLNLLRNTNIHQVAFPGPGEESE